MKKCRYQSKEIVIEFFNALLENRIEKSNQRHPPPSLILFTQLELFFSVSAALDDRRERARESKLTVIMWFELSCFPHRPHSFSTIHSINSCGFAQIFLILMRDENYTRFFVNFKSIFQNNPKVFENLLNLPNKIN